MPQKNPPTTGVTLSANARTVLEKRYLVRDKSGKPTETVEEMFWRVATTIAEPDRHYGKTDAEVDAKVRTQGIAPKIKTGGAFDAHIRQDMAALEPVVRTVAGDNR